MSLFFRAQISPVTEFVGSTYEEFEELSTDEKVIRSNCYRYKKIPVEPSATILCLFVVVRLCLEDV